jgi:hypothetical protein
VFFHIRFWLFFSDTKKSVIQKIQKKIKSKKFAFVEININDRCVVIDWRSFRHSKMSLITFFSGDKRGPFFLDEKP